MVQALTVVDSSPIERAWETYARLMRGLLENNELALNRSYMEDIARAEQAWKAAFLSGEAN